MLKYLQMKEELMKIVDKRKLDDMTDYFTNDIPAINEQCFIMVKTRLEDVLKDTAEDNENLDLGVNPAGADAFKARTDPILDILTDLTSLKPNEDFDNPIVLSFMSNSMTDNNFIPEGMFSVFEFNRLELSATGKLK